MPMMCLFLLPVIAKIPTDCLILIGCWKVSLNLIACLKKLSRRTKCSPSLDLENFGLYAGHTFYFQRFVVFVIFLSRLSSHVVYMLDGAWLLNILLRDNNNMKAAAALLYFGPIHAHNRRREKPTVEEKFHRSCLLFSRVKNNVWCWSL